jgi:hypothetical protein
MFDGRLEKNYKGSTERLKYFSPFFVVASWHFLPTTKLQNPHQEKGEKRMSLAEVARLIF